MAKLRRNTVRTLEKQQNKWGPEQAIKWAIIITRFPQACQEEWYRKMNAHYGIPRITTAVWIKREPLMTLAKELALQMLKAKTDERENFGEFVLTRMSKENRERYEQLLFWEDHPDGASKTRGILRDMTERERRIMFVQCVAANGFVYSRALKLMGISGDVVKNWNRDRGFRAMTNEIQQLKKDFFEQALVDLAAARDTTAVVFANKTLNRDRGYGEKLSVDVKGQIDHTHTVVPLAALEELPTEVLDTVLKAVQEHKRKQMEARAAGPSVLTLPGDTGETIDVEEAASGTLEEDDPPLGRDL